MTDNKASVETSMVSSKSRCSSERAVLRSKWAEPRTPLSGVRNSWLMLATKIVLAALAASARSRSRCAICFSAFTRSNKNAM